MGFRVIQGAESEKVLKNYLHNKRLYFDLSGLNELKTAKILRKTDCHVFSGKKL